MDQQFEESNAYSKLPHKRLCAGVCHADLGQNSDSFAGRMKANLKITHGEVLSKASHAHRRSYYQHGTPHDTSGRNFVPKPDIIRYC
jgi:hypothetical protein